MTHLGDLLSGLVDGELGEAELAQVHAHLAGCPQCRAERESVLRIKLLVAAMPLLDPPASMRLIIGRLRARRSLPWIGAAAVAAMVLVALPLPVQQQRLAPSLASLVQFHPPSSASSPSSAAASSLGPGAHVVSRASVSTPFVAPATLAGGYRLISVLKKGGSIEADYSNGRDALSVFERLGSLDIRSLVASAHDVVMRAEGNRHYAWSGAQVTTWQAGATVYTVVGDGDEASVMAAARSVPGPRHYGLVEHVRQVCRRLLSQISRSD